MIRKIELATPKHRYGLQYRPPGLGAVPKGWTDYSKDNENLDGVRHGILTYDRELSLSEVNSYELLPLDSKDGKPLELPKFPEAVVKKVADALRTLKTIEDEGTADELEDEVADANKILDIFRNYARSKKLDADKALTELRGRL